MMTTLRLLTLGVAALSCVFSAVTSRANELFFEDFEGLTLGPVVTLQSEVREREAWTETAPTGWVVDDSGIPQNSNPLIGVEEFKGWSFVDKDWWNQTAGQGRGDFFNGRGIVAVADPDEWDDFAAAGQDAPETFGFFDASLTTPSISLGSAGTNELKAFLNSSWRPEAEDNGDLNNLNNQTATITAIYDVGDPVEVLRWDSIESSPTFKEEALNESLTIDLLNPAGASSVQLEFRLFNASNDWWWAFDNLQVFTGDNPPVDEVLRTTIDRDTQEVTIVNRTGEPVEITGYSITSADGVFDEAAASFLSDTEAGWLQATIVGDEPNDLSEVHLTSDTLAADGEIALGSVWRQYYIDEADVSFQYLVEGSLDPVPGIVEFTGNGDESFEFLDLDFNGQIDILDWEVFKAGFGTPLDGLSRQQQYALGELTGDGVHGFDDFIDFQLRYDAALGAGAFQQALAAIPEPGTLSLVGFALVGLACRRRALRNAQLMNAPLLGVLLAATLLVSGDPAVAQIKLLEEDFEGLDLLDPIEETTAFEAFPDGVVTPIGPAGWVTDNSLLPGLGDPETDGVVDFAGWTFVSRDWWDNIEQDRDQFSRGVGTILVADSDEWDDDANPIDDPDLVPGTAATATFNTFISTPVIGIPSIVPAGKLQLAFDSSWRDEFDDPTDGGKGNQTATISVSYNTGSSIEVLRWESDPESDFFKDDATNERVSIDLQFDGTATDVQIEFGVTNADNDWWWGIDNLLVSVPAEPSILEVNTVTGEATLIGGDTIPSDIQSIDIQSENGVLSGAAVGLAANAGDTADGFDPGATAGDAPGEQWEVLTSSDTRFAEAFLFGASTFDASRSVSLGDLFDTATSEADRDLTFSYLLATGDVVEGLVQYVDTGLVPGDFNGDGRVDNGDLNLLLGNWGESTVPAEWTNGFGSPTVDNGELNALLGDWGFGASVAIPEPASVTIVALAAAGLLVRRTRRAATAAAVVATLTVTGAAEAVVPSPFVDRDYRFGDFDLGSLPGAPETPGNTVAVRTRDSEGAIGVNDRINLTPGSDLFQFPKYVEVTDRPDGVSGIGIQLNPRDIEFLPGVLEENYLRTAFGEALNYPERSASSTFAVPAGPNDYTEIRDRGFELWVKPTEVRAGERSDIVMDTNQHGVFIDEEGFYAMRYAERDFSSPIPAVEGEWAHLSVVRPFEGGRGSILWVDGVAAAAAVGDYRIERVAPRDPDAPQGETNIGDLDTSPLVIGASTGQAASEVGASNFFSGVVDDLSMFVMGFNNTNDYGEFEFERDNGFAAFDKPIVDGDLTGDNLVTLADATAFAAGWRFENRLEWTEFNGQDRSLVVGDLVSRDQGDFNYDGVVNLADWAILNAASPSAAAFAMSIISGAVPEPTALLLVSVATGVLGAGGRRRSESNVSRCA